MARREFPKQVLRDAFMRASGQCEGVLDNGSRCFTKLQTAKFQYDHIVPDALFGEPTLENCQVLCTKCHQVKTAKDKADIAEAVRRSDRHLGIVGPGRRRMTSRNTFPKSPPQNRASGYRRPEFPS